METIKGKNKYRLRCETCEHTSVVYLRKGFAYDPHYKPIHYMIELQCQYCGEKWWIYEYQGADS